MGISFENGSSMETIDSNEQKRSSGITVTMYPVTLELFREKQCCNCIYWQGDEHDYTKKNCEKCMNLIEQSQRSFQRRLKEKNK